MKFKRRIDLYLFTWIAIFLIVVVIILILNTRIRMTKITNEADFPIDKEEIAEIVEDKQIVEDEVQKLKPQLKPEGTNTHDHIKTFIYSYRDNKGQAVMLSESGLDLTTLLVQANSIVSSQTNQVCGIGIFNTRFFIQVDDRIQSDKEQKVNILTLVDDISESEWISLLEDLHNNYYVSASELFNYDTDKGSTQYIYVYQALIDEDISKHNETVEPADE